jgi:phage nucleotide-binding protein
MAINLKTTRSVSATGINLLVYGQAGAGKTTLVSTLPNPVVLSAEGGLLSLSNHDIPFVEIDSAETVAEVYKWLVGSDEAKQFESVALDSISEIAEVILSSEKAKTKDPRQAYGVMQDQMAAMIRAFRDLPKFVYFSAKLEKSQDEMGRLLYSPSMPGNKTGQALPYFFDEVLALRCEPSDEGVVRALLCQPDGMWQAKDRSGKLETWEEPHLGKILEKIGGSN